MSRRPHTQCHFWISEVDYIFLKQLADSRGETLSAIVRQLIRQARLRIANATTEPRSGRNEYGVRRVERHEEVALTTDEFPTVDVRPSD